MDNSLKDTFICVISKNKFARDIGQFLSEFNGVLSVFTNLNYNTLPIENNVLKIPVLRYTNEDIKMTPQELIDKRINELITYCESIDVKKLSKKMLHSFRAIMMKYNINDLFIVRVITKVEYENRSITINFGNLSKIPNYTLKKIEFVDGSSIMFYLDELLNDNGMYLNLSIPYNEMGFAYNALHLYEHLMTKGWWDTEIRRISYYNGATYPNGICYIYGIFKNADDLKYITNKTINHVIKSRSKDFWTSDKMMKNIKFEIVRTISESIDDRSLRFHARTGPDAYEDNNIKKMIDIFNYWSNRPFNALICSNDLTLMENMNKSMNIINNFIKRHPLNKVDIPKEIKIDFLPLDILKKKKYDRIKVTKLTPEEVHEIIMKGPTDDDQRGLIGIDNIYVSDIEDLGVMNTLLHPMLFLNYSVEDVLKILNTNPFPMNCNDVMD